MSFWPNLRCSRYGCSLVINNFADWCCFSYLDIEWYVPDVAKWPKHKSYHKTCTRVQAVKRHFWKKARQWHRWASNLKYCRFVCKKHKESYFSHSYFSSFLLYFLRGTISLVISMPASNANRPGLIPGLGIAGVDTVCYCRMWIKSFGRDTKPGPRLEWTIRLKRTLNPHLSLPSFSLICLCFVIKSLNQCQAVYTLVMACNFYNCSLLSTGFLQAKKNAESTTCVLVSLSKMFLRGLLKK